MAASSLLPMPLKGMIGGLFTVLVLTVDVHAFLSVPQKEHRRGPSLQMANPFLCPELPLTPTIPGNEVACVACG